MQSSGESSSGGTSKKELVKPDIQRSSNTLLTHFFSGTNGADVENEITDSIADLQSFLDLSNKFLDKYPLNTIQTVKSVGTEKKDKVRLTQQGEDYTGVICRDDKLLAKLVWKENTQDFLLSVTEIAMKMGKYEMIVFELKNSRTLSELEVLLVDIDQNSSSSNSQSSSSLESILVKNIDLQSSSYQSVLSKFSEYSGQTKFSGDEYQVGFSSESSKNDSLFVSYDSDCSKSFNREDPSDSWCKSGNIFESSSDRKESGSKDDKSQQTNKNEAKENWNKLKNIGIRSDETLKVPQEFLDTNLCRF